MINGNKFVIREPLPTGAIPEKSRSIAIKGKPALVASREPLQVIKPSWENSSPRKGSRLSDLAARICSGGKESFSSFKKVGSGIGGCKVKVEGLVDSEIFHFEPDDGKESLFQKGRDANEEPSIFPHKQIEETLPSLEGGQEEKVREPLFSPRLEQCDALEQRAPSRGLSAEIYRFIRLSDEEPRGKCANSILKRYLKYRWISSARPGVTRSQLEQRCADYFLNEIKDLYEISKVCWSSYLEEEASLVWKFIFEVCNERLLLTEIVERLEILYSAVQSQLLLLECLTEWGFQLYSYIDRLTRFDENSPVTLSREGWALARFVAVVNEIDSLAKDNQRAEGPETTLRALILQAVGETPEEIREVIAFLNKWAFSFANESQLFKEVSDQVRSIACSVYPEEVRALAERMEKEKV